MKGTTNNTKQAAWVALGNLFTFSFGIVSAMILSRYFNKIEYGTYKQVFYIYNILLGMFTLGLPNAYSYFLAKSPLNQARDLILKMTRLFMILGIIMSLSLFLGSGSIADLMKNPDLKEMLIIFSPVPFFMLPTLGLQSILVTFRCSNIIPLYVIATSLAQFLCVVVPVISFGLGCKGALIGFNIGSLAAFCLAMFLNNYPVKKEPMFKSEETYRDIFKFSMPLFVATIWGSLIISTDQFFISRYFGTEVFADFSNGATDLPFVGMIIGAASAVLTPLFTKAVHNGGDVKKAILPVWDSVFAKSAMLIYPIAIFCFFEAKEIMTSLYGNAYEDSSDFFRIKVITYFFKIIAFYPLIIALGASKFYQSVHFYEFLGLVLTEFLVVTFFKNPLYITIVSVFYTAAACLIFVYYISKRLGISFWSMFPKDIILKVFILALAICFFISWLDPFDSIFDIQLIKLIFDFALFVLLFGILSLVFKLNYLNIIKPLLYRN